MEKSYPGCWQVVREAYLRKNMAEVSMEILRASLSKNTEKQYNTTLKKWWNFCNGDLERVFESDTKQLSEFLTREYNNGAKYATLNAHRSALNLILNLDNNQSKLISRILKGAFRSRPSLPRYQETWDPQPVLLKLAQWQPLESLTFLN